MCIRDSSLTREDNGCWFLRSSGSQSKVMIWLVPDGNFSFLFPRSQSYLLCFIFYQILACSKVFQLKEAHFTRAGNFATPVSASMSSNPLASEGIPVVIISWKDVTPASASATDRPWAYSVIILEAACEIEQPAPVKAICSIRSSVTVTCSWISSPHKGFAPFAEHVESVNSPLFRGCR